MVYHILGSCFCCYFVDRFLTKWFTRKTSNIITCTIFQLQFISKAFLLSYRSLLTPRNSPEITTIINLTQNNLDTLSGYFIYDIFALYSNWNWINNSYLSFGYLIHHILSIWALYCLKIIKIYPHMVFYYNLYFFTIEIQNPLSNLLNFTTNTILFKLNMKLYYYIYSIFRIIFFPLMSYKIYTIIDKINPNLALYSYFSTLLIYGMSLFYYLDIFKTHKNLDKIDNYRHW